MMKSLIVVLMLCLMFAVVSAQDELEPGDVRTDAYGIDQVWVPAGCFMMGTSETEAEYAQSLEAPAWASGRITSEQPQHEVCLTAGYWIDQYEVTNAAYQAFIDDDGYTALEYWSERGQNWLKGKNIENLPAHCVEATADDLPRVCVTWYEAEAYAHWRGGMLPTEAQWEFAARGTDSLIYPWGNEWDESLANVVDSTESTPVGSYPDGVSWVGAYDMAGNAMEWVQDWLAPNYKNVTETDDPTGPASGSKKVEKGGWFGSNPVAARSAYRHFEDPPSYQDHHIGFRIVSVE